MATIKIGTGASSEVDPATAYVAGNGSKTLTIRLSVGQRKKIRSALAHKRSVVATV